MKYVVVLSDGMAGRPLSELDGKTTLEAAETPVMDELAPVSELGMASMVPEGMAPGSDTANLSVMGYDPRIYYTGRSPLEALSIGVEMEESDVSFRCNLVTLSEEDVPYGERTILDHSSDEIATKDAAELLKALEQGLKQEGFSFYVGTSYRHLLIWKEGRILDLTPPHDVLGRKIEEYLPEDPVFREMMEKSYEILEHHPINEARRRQGLHPANSAWFWGAGKKPSLPDFQERTGKRGIMISAVDLLKGIAVGAGMDCAFVEGANGGLHTNYEGKAATAAEALIRQGYDFAYIHVEAPDEMGHQGSVEKKVKAIERLDERIIRPIAEGLAEAGEDFRMVVLPDHPTPISLRTHTADNVPYLLYDSTAERSESWHYNEREAAQTANFIPEGHKLIEYLLQM